MSTTHQKDKKRAYNYCIHLLARREYSQHELITKLKHAGHCQETINDCLQQLVSQNYQSDERFTEMFVRSRINQRYGLKKISYELNQRGISHSLINKYLSGFDEVLLENAQSLIQKKVAISELNDKKTKDKITRYLIGRGYDFSTINHAISNLKQDN